MSSADCWSNCHSFLFYVIPPAVPYATRCVPLVSVGSRVFTGGRSYQSLGFIDLLCRVRLSFFLFLFFFFKHSFSLCNLGCFELTVVLLPQTSKCRDHSLSHRTQQYLAMLMLCPRWCVKTGRECYWLCWKSAVTESATRPELSRIN